MRLRDNPTVEVSERLECSPEHAWALITDIELPTRADGELQRVEWLDGAAGVAVGARFRGYNANPQAGEWHTEPEITEVEDGRRWVWRVGPADEPLAVWGFEVDSDGDGAVVRQWAKAGTGRSPLSDFIEQYPDKEGTILAHRLAVWRDGMAANLAVLKQLAG
ncbi:SRPBCC family protein [Rhodococcus tukisamuensis]|uniref:Polyketide cyclase / dehydrase and lipid transport n=1 Tax=Rhodococcus tukisamuensis TaxID=168276 RepID=A0A1G6T2T1_9NOCA|nr:SRPBCC family protein [Rhodococcus tukisamuensis]SDD22846.1 Polyketide cyclase / dehydrase and lipid transport [Rhodococcus tukisamuensis]